MPLCSVVMATHDNLPCLRLCLDSLRRCTGVPAELIVVDNGSRDGTAGFLAELAGRPGLGGGPAPLEVRVLRNEANQPVPRAWNQGLAAARGRFLAVCNDDLVLTLGWLEALVEALEGDLEAGIVCPVETYNLTQVLRDRFAAEAAAVDGWNVCPPERAAVDALYGGSLDRFALSFRERYGGVRLPHPTGACMVLRRELVEDVGPFDEGLGWCFYEDVDYFLRTLLNRRYNRVYAVGVYVHHFAARTTGRLDVPDLLARARAAFLRKWPPEARRLLARFHPQCQEVSGG